MLIVDDDEDIREVSRLTLTMLARWRVDTAAGGGEAIEIAERERPDAILLDMMMPDMDGAATVRQLHARETTRDIPIILLTAKLKTVDDGIGEALGVAGVITKPFDPMQLPDQVGRLLGWSR